MRRNTILVVDDSPETLGFLTETLDRAGYTVLIATDATGALELVDRITPDLVLLDAVMPGMDGFEACRRLKRDKLLGELPVIFMTGLGQTENIVEGLAAGGVDYVVKPIVIDELLARIRVHLNNARAAQHSRDELDASGRYLLATDGEGQLRWCTNKARALLLSIDPVDDARANQLPAPVVRALKRLRSDSERLRAKTTLEVGERRLEFTYLSATGPDEFLFCLAETRVDGEYLALQERFPLTAREAQVLLWLSRGKTNRDIGAILDISPRTINKHLERVFEKLGVENRASAAVQAVRTLGATRDAAYASVSIPSRAMKSTTVSRP